MDELFRFVHFLFGVRHDQAVQVFVLVAGVGSVRLALSFLDRSLAANCNLGARLVLHLLESVATRADE
jgi:hypothetical protein